MKTAVFDMKTAVFDTKTPVFDTETALFDVISVRCMVQRERKNQSAAQ